MQRQEAIFWFYLGVYRFDIVVADALALSAIGAAVPVGCGRQYAKRIKLAIQWLLAQEHQRFFLLQQTRPATGPTSCRAPGFVLYTNTLWYCVKRLYGIEHAQETHENFNGLFHPFSADIAEYRRARLLNDYVLQRGATATLYLSFVNFSFFGEEGDVFGNVLAVLLGLADARASTRTLDALTKAQVNDPYPVRVVTRPIKTRQFACGGRTWRVIGKNFVWQYHIRGHLADGGRILDRCTGGGRPAPGRPR